MNDDNDISNLMDYLGIPRTREAAIALEFLGEPPEPWTVDAEMALPEDLQDWSLFEIVNGELVAKK